MGNVSAFLSLVGTLFNVLAMISWLIGKKQETIPCYKFRPFFTSWTTNKVAYPRRSDSRVRRSVPSGAS